MKSLQLIKYLLPLLVVAVACKDVTEPDLSKEVITLYSPNDHDTVPAASLTFWWKKVDDTKTYKYRLQIVKPNFTVPQTPVIDTLITLDKFVYTLGPGTYQWRVRTENNSSHSAYTTRDLVVDTNKVLSNQQVILTSPDGLSPVTTLTVNFTWQAVASATSYYIKIKQNDGTDVIAPTNVTTNQYTYVFSNYGVYKWSAMAANDYSQTQYAAYKTFTVAIKDPTPLQNADSNTVGQPMVLNWTNYAPATGDSLVIYKDAVSTSSVAISTYAVSSYSVYANTTTPSAHTYYWKIKSLDPSGNMSQWVNGHTFKLK
ncbi:MAG: hypothetical protein JST26_08000 [Bacteroidetes bacterium]|nr:hypothetical protein [Bacteroidota bacterium]